MINDLQKKLYSYLKDNTQINVYDEPIKEPVFPFVVISDYTLEDAEYKGNGYIFNWNVDIYTDYEGKKEVNDILDKIVLNLDSLEGMSVNEVYGIDETLLLSANVSRNEGGYYIANTIIKIEIV